MADDTIKNAIETNATGPRRASGDSGSVEQHPLPDQVAAAKFAASQTPIRKKGLGVKLLKMSPGGSV